MTAEVGVPRRKRRWNPWTVPIVWSSEKDQKTELNAYVRARTAKEAQILIVEGLFSRRFYGVDVKVVPLDDAA